MASTRNKNTLIDYSLQQRFNQETEQYNLYINGASGTPINVYLPGNGLGNSHIRGRQQAINQVDIESFLRGTGTVNLSKGTYTQLTPDLICIPSLNMFVPDPVIMPLPFTPQENRPWPI
jgi:hypothetical protein